MKTIVLVFIGLLSCISVTGQEGHEEGSEAEKEFKRSRIMFVLGHTHVPKGVNREGKKSFLTLASFGLDYDFRLNSFWSIGLHTDMVLENFEYDEEEGIEFTRSRPLAVVLCASRKFGEHLSLLAGGGLEFAKEGTLGLARVGLDYGWELPKDWELALSLMFDIKFEGYDSLVFGIGLGKYF